MPSAAPRCRRGNNYIIRRGAGAEGLLVICEERGGEPREHVHTPAHSRYINTTRSSRSNKGKRSPPSPTWPEHVGTTSESETKATFLNVGVSCCKVTRLVSGRRDRPRTRGGREGSVPSHQMSESQASRRGKYEQKQRNTNTHR